VMPDGCVDVFVTAQGDVMIAGPANTFYGDGSRDRIGAPCIAAAV